MRGRGRSLRLAWFTQFQDKFQDNQKYIERLISKKQNKTKLNGLQYINAFVTRRP